MSAEAFLASISSPEDRLRYCFERLLPFVEERAYIVDRAFIEAGRLFSRTRKGATAIGRSIRRPGSVEGYISRHTRLNLPLPQPSQLSSGDVGRVYLARLRDYPFIVKVGFSRNLPQRMRDLSSSTKCTHDLVSSRPGLLFDEAMEFVARRADHINNEWFFDRDFPIGPMPEFLSFGLTDAQWKFGAALAKAQASRSDSSAASALSCVYMLGMTRPELYDALGAHE